MVKFSCFLLIITILCFSNLIQTSTLAIESEESLTSQWKTGCNKYSGSRKKRCNERKWCKKSQNAKFCDYTGLKKTCNRGYYLNNNAKCVVCKSPGKIRNGRCVLKQSDCNYGTYFRNGKCLKVTCKRGYQPKKAGVWGCKKIPNYKPPKAFSFKGCSITYNPVIKNKRVKRCSLCCDGYYLQGDLSCKKIGTAGVKKLTGFGTVMHCLNGWTKTRLDKYGRTRRDKKVVCVCKSGKCSTKLPSCKYGH